MTDPKEGTEELHVQGDQIVGKIKELLRQGNIRRISVKNEAGKTLLDIPLTLGVVGALFVPQLAALGVIVALVTSCTIVVEKTDEEA
jgi:hypothetical protein